MNFPRHWALAEHRETGPSGTPIVRQAWGWSSVSMEDARAVATKRARRAVDAQLGNGSFDEYEYGETPPREEIIEKLDHGEQPLATITRNRYGALVLNSPCVLFADIDRPERRPFSLIKRLFGGGRETDDVVPGLVDWQRTNSRRSFRIYETANGWRLLFTDGIYNPVAPESLDLLKSLNADPLYFTLTKKQQCFRARLTPKPWRCGSHAVPVKFPFADAAGEKRFASWKEKYERASRNYSVCRFLQSVGSAGSHPMVMKTIDLHDRYTCTELSKLA